MLVQDNRNIINHYKYWETDAIKADLDTKRFNFNIICVNIQGDFNIGTVIRSSNAFLAKKVYIYGKKRFDRRGTVGTHLYENLQHVKYVDEFPENVKNSHIIAVDNVDNAKALETYKFPDKEITLCFGEEGSGLPEEIMQMANDIVYIKQYGSVRSLNVGSAASIIMYEFVKQSVSRL